MSRKKPCKFSELTESEKNEFKLLHELEHDRKVALKKKAEEKEAADAIENNTLTSLDLSKTFCENINKLSESPNNIKLTDFGRKSAANATKSVMYARASIFTNGTGELFQMPSDGEEETKPKPKPVNKRLNAIQKEQKLPYQTSPSMMNQKTAKKKAPKAPKASKQRSYAQTPSLWPVNSKRPKSDFTLLDELSLSRINKRKREEEEQRKKEEEQRKKEEEDKAKRKVKTYVVDDDDTSDEEPKKKKAKGDSPSVKIVPKNIPPTKPAEEEKEKQPPKAIEEEKPVDEEEPPFEEIQYHQEFDDEEIERALKSVNEAMPPFKKVEERVPKEINTAWLKRSNQEKQNLSNAIESMKNLNNVILDFRKDLAERIANTTDSAKSV